jgi:two-component system sensor histidine kinase MprB
VPARPQMIERAVSNLVDNAVKYSPAGSPVEITVTGGRLIVRDHGAGIATEDQPHVFERFYRAAGARAAPGSGLGLAIVDQTVRRHAGRLLLTNHPDGGAEVGFELPTTGPV